MKAEVQIVPMENRIYLRLEAETPAEAIVLKSMEYWSPTFDFNMDGKLEASFDCGRHL